jgi:hypothetical protein
MPRPCERVRLENGLKLDLNRLRRQGFVRPRATVWQRGIGWSNSYTGGTIATGLISAGMEGDWEGWFRIQLGNGLDQRIILVARPRRFGGHQWYFICPVMNRRCSVLWRPPGATSFCSRQKWGRQAAYSSQFETPSDRAWRAKRKIKDRLIADLDPEEWELPPKPKGMRWRTYNRYVDRYDRAEDALERDLAIAFLRWKKYL